MPKYHETRCVCETQMLPIIDGQNQMDRCLDILSQEMLTYNMKAVMSM